MKSFKKIINFFSMEIIIKIENKIVSLILQDKRKIIDEGSFEGEYQLSEKLLPEIDKLLKRNNLKLEDIKKIKSEVDGEKSITSYRIAKTAEKIFNWANSCKLNIQKYYPPLEKGD